MICVGVCVDGTVCQGIEACNSRLRKTAAVASPIAHRSYSFVSSDILLNGLLFVFISIQLRA